MANSAAPCVSPTKRMPSGPKANGPADFRSGFPCLRLAVGSAPGAIAAVKHTPASAMAATRIPILGIFGSPLLLDPRLSPMPDVFRRIRYYHRPDWRINEAVRKL